MGVNIVSLYQVRKSYGDRVVLDGVSLGIDAGEKLGVVGANGAGKSTMLKALVGLELPDEGAIARGRDVTVGYLAQDPPLPAGRTVREVVSEGLASLEAARREAAEIAHALEAHDGDEAAAGLLARYEAIVREVERLGGWDTGHRVERVMTHLGIADIAERSVDLLSGGQRKRTALAQVLLAAPRLLVLDEPTNHLDADTVQWLEDTLAATSSSVVLVTHDRYFLDKVVTRMLELAGGQLTSYIGNYTAFLEQKHARLELQQRTEARRLKLLEQELAWIGRAPSARGTKQKARIQRAEALAEEAPAPREESVGLRFEPQKALRGDTILNAIGLAKGYEGLPLFHDFTLRMVRGDRIGIIGPNGCGKTTLLKVLLGREPATTGRVELGRATHIGYFDQERSTLPRDATLLEALGASGEYVKVGEERMHVRTYLQEFLFRWSEQSRPVSSLSGGELSRLALARLMAEGANLIVLDEPTNDLDLDTLQVLEDALAHFKGCLLCVTHDRYFLNRVTNRILAFVGAGEVRNYAGDYELYRKTREEELAAEARARVAEAPKPVAAPARKRVGLNWKEERELEALEGEVAALEERRRKLEARLADPGPLAGDPAKLRALAEKHAEVAATLEARYERWSELMERKEGGA